MNIKLLTIGRKPFTADGSFFFKGFGQVDKVLTNEGGFSKMSTLALSLSTVCLFLSQ